MCTGAGQPVSANAAGETSDQRLCPCSDRAPDEPTGLVDDLCSIILSLCPALTTMLQAVQALSPHDRSSATDPLIIGRPRHFTGRIVSVLFRVPKDMSRKVNCCFYVLVSRWAAPCCPEVVHTSLQSCQRRLVLLPARYLATYSVAPTLGPDTSLDIGISISSTAIIQAILGFSSCFAFQRGGRLTGRERLNGARSRLPPCLSCGCGRAKKLQVTDGAQETVAGLHISADRQSGAVLWSIAP
ncbi:hypothetical protein BDV19DRAFT_322130 [Aspergillus venezuelensis]